MAAREHSKNSPSALAALFLLLASACAQLEPVAVPDTVPELRPGILQGYLPPDALPNSAALVPPPPAEDSAAMAQDRQAAEAAVAERGTPRWALATADAELSFPAAAATFSCALGAPISEEETPNLYMLLRRSLTDLGLSTYAAKNRYQRTRPFAVNGAPTCTPDDEAALRGNGSYPSGHAAIGWGWALILAEVAPDRANELLARGRAFGQSRVICNVHWTSDVAAGWNMGAAAVARLHGDPVFRAQLDLARDEVEALVASGERPARDCDEEMHALAATGG